VLASNANGALDYYTFLTPSVLGDRVGGIAQYFARFRFNSLKFELKAKLSTNTGGTIVCGVLDDYNGNGVNTTPAQVLDFRVSSERHVFSDQTLRWSPLDRDKWYYVVAGIDPRLQYPCSFFVTTDDGLPVNSNIFSFDLHYSITFEGAAPIGFGVSDDYVSLPPTPSGSMPSIQPPRTNPTLRR